jgi:hypothetical protein
MARRDKGCAAAVCSGGGLGRSREGFLASRVLAFLRDESNRALLGWIGGGIVVFATGLWAVFTFYVDHSTPPPPPATTIVEQKGTGIASGRDTNINAQVTISTGITPEMLAALTRPWEELSESQKKEIAKLQGDLDLNQRQVKSALEILGEKNVPPEQIAAKLVEIAGKYKELRTAAISIWPSPGLSLVWWPQRKSLCGKSSIDDRGERAMTMSNDDVTMQLWRLAIKPLAGPGKTSVEFFYKSQRWVTRWGREVAEPVQSGSYNVLVLAAFGRKWRRWWWGVLSYKFLSNPRLIRVTQ